MAHPRILHTALDAVDVRGLAEFWRELLGGRYRDGDEPPADGSPDEADWLVVLGPGGDRLAFQQVDELTPTTWPSPEVPMQAHLDLWVATVEELHDHRARAEALGARLLLDRTSGPEGDQEPLVVLADPAGHPFCLLVAAPA